MFEISYTDDAVSDLKRLKKNEPKAFKKRFVSSMSCVSTRKQASGIPNR